MTKNSKSQTKLVNISDIKRAIRMNNPLGTIIASCAMRLMGFCRINKLFPQYSHLYGREFIDGAMKAYHIKYDIRIEELDSIPSEGPFIIVSNHPFGGWDGMVLYNTVSQKRPDFKILTNFLLSHIENLKEIFLPVNPFSDNKKIKNSFSGLRSARDLVEKGGGLALFPAGEVSTYYGNKYPSDKLWQPAMIKLIKNCNVPVIPVYFDGSNSKLFHILGKIHPILRTMRLPNEVNNKYGKTITLRIGKPILPSESDEYTDLKEYGEYLRNRTYALEANLYDNHYSSGKASYKEAVAGPQDKQLILKEIDALKKESLLFEVSSYKCFLANPEDIPTLIKEIGRKREESFREVGEGTNKPFDTDSFDNYYKHLFLWDKDNSEIVGAYRLGIGSEIINKYGLNGFYTQTLFDYSKSFIDQLSVSIELGRSFISPQYQKEALPLMLLLKGLLYSVVKYEDCKYLIGPVSISSWYSPFYQSLMVHYLLSKQSNDYFKDFVTPRNPFKLDFIRVDVNSLLSKKMDSIERFDRFMMKLSDNEYRLPTLIKKYIKLNSKILAFNVDKEFNYCLDGLILLNIKDVPKEELVSLSKGSDDLDIILNRFGYGTGS